MGHYHWKWVLHMKRKFALTSCFEANRNCINCNRKGMHLQCQSTRGMSLQFKLSGAKMIGKYPIYYQNKRKYYKHFPSSCKQKHDRDLTIRQTEQKPLHTSTWAWAHYPSITTIGLRVCVFLCFHSLFSIFMMFSIVCSWTINIEMCKHDLCNALWQSHKFRSGVCPGSAIDRQKVWLYVYIKYIQNSKQEKKRENRNRKILTPQ